MTKKSIERKEIAEDVKAFLKTGGKIKKIASQYVKPRTYKAEGKDSGF